jgi:hypothetical protein
MAKLSVYFKELVPKSRVDAANTVSFVIYDPVKDIDRRVGLAEIQSYLQDHLLFNQEGKQVYDLGEAEVTTNNYTTSSPEVKSYKVDDVYIVKPESTNTGPGTFQINAGVNFPALPLLKMSDDTVAPIEPGDFKNTSVLLYRTDHFLLFSSNGNEEKVLETITAGEDLLPGNLVTPGNDGKWYKADCLTESKTEGNIAFVTTSILIDTKGTVTRIGLVNTTGLTPGGIYYVGVNGNISYNGVPEVEPVFMKKIGTAISSTILDFNPSLDFVELSSVGTVEAPFLDAPADGKYYARKDNAWVNVEEIMLLNSLMY